MPVPAITERTLSAIAAHPLTGNVRELENLLHRAVALGDGDTLCVDDLQPCASGPMPLDESQPSTFSALAADAPIPSDLQSHLDQQERDILAKTLQETGFNRTLAASRLGLSLRQIRYRIARLKIDMPLSRDDGADD